MLHGVPELPYESRVNPGDYVGERVLMDIPVDAKYERAYRISDRRVACFDNREDRSWSIEVDWLTDVGLIRSPAGDRLSVTFNSIEGLDSATIERMHALLLSLPAMIGRRGRVRRSPAQPDDATLHAVQGDAEFHLQPGERLLWTGRPGPEPVVPIWKRLWRKLVQFFWSVVVPTGLLVVAIKVYDQYSAVRWILLLFGGPWLLTGAWGMFVSPFTQLPAFQDTGYALTNIRAIITSSNGQKVHCDSHFLDMLGHIQLEVDENGRGSVWSFRRIDDAVQVQSLLLDAICRAGGPLASGPSILDDGWD